MYINLSTVKLIKRFLLVLCDTNVIKFEEMNTIVSELKHLAEKCELKPAIMPKLIDQKEVAELLGISLANFKKLEKEGAFPFKRKMVGSSVRYLNIDIHRFILSENS